MNDNKKPGEPLETEGRVMEDEIQKLKRSSLILSVACSCELSGRSATSTAPSKSSWATSRAFTEAS